MNEMQPEYILSLWVTLNQNNQCSQSGTDRKRDSKKAGLPDSQQCHLLARSQAYHTVSISVPRFGPESRRQKFNGVSIASKKGGRNVFNILVREANLLVIFCTNIVCQYKNGLARFMPGGTINRALSRTPLLYVSSLERTFSLVVL